MFSPLEIKLMAYVRMSQLIWWFEAISLGFFLWV